MLRAADAIDTTAANAHYVAATVANEFHGVAARPRPD